MSNHRFKQVPAPAPKPCPSIRELVTKHGDIWALMAPYPSKEFSAYAKNSRVDASHDEHDFYLMQGMERGYLPRCDEVGK